jgi:hypothetical protein
LEEERRAAVPRGDGVAAEALDLPEVQELLRRGNAVPILE